MGAVRPPYEDDQPLAIDPNRMFAGPIALQRLERIPWRRSQVVQPLGGVDRLEFSPRGHGELQRHSPWGSPPENTMAVALSRRLTITILCAT
jgi:hypothetical protein